MTSVRPFGESVESVPTQSPVIATREGSRGLLVVYCLAIFLSAFLLFQVQPLVGKFVLPWFGGTPSVWTTCMLFFQVLLFGGYAYAHLTTSRLAPRSQSILHGVLLVAACLTLPIIPGGMFKPTGTEEPISRIVLVLTATVGAPFLVLSTTGPLVQSWFSRTHPGRSPYRLYALSNAGSLLALVTFPVIFEWLFPRMFLAWLWSASFVAFAVLCGICVWAAATRGQPVCRTASDSNGADRAVPSWGTWGLWFALAMIPSVLLVATTNQVCLDVATVPFLWVLPLTLYLLTFILCFDGQGWYSRRFLIPAMMLAMAGVCYVIDQGSAAGLGVQLLAYFGALFLCAMVCHGELVRRKPDVRHLTAFYLVISAGGAVGGIFVGIVAPLVFSGYYELHVGLFACALLILGILVLDRRQLPVRGRWQAVGLLLLLAALGTLGKALVENSASRRENVVKVARTFYGVLRVTNQTVPYGDAPDHLRGEPTHELLNGDIAHGFQFLNPTLRRRPTSYYGVDSGVARVLSLPLDGPRRAGVVGLGTGTLAIYARPGDHFRFYEINAKVEELARTDFSYLSDCKGDVEVIQGDARLNLSRESPQGFNVLVLDAFSGDAIPVHLLTREAFAIYLRHMAPDGIIVVHISSRHFKLEPVVLAMADVYGLATATIHSPRKVAWERASTWVLVSASSKALRPARIRNAQKPKQSDARVLWTDDHTSLLEVWLE